MRRTAIALALLTTATVSSASAGNVARDFCKHPTDQERSNEALMAECRALEEARKYPDFFQYLTEQMRNWSVVIKDHAAAGATVKELTPPRQKRGEPATPFPSSPVEEGNRK